MNEPTSTHAACALTRPRCRGGGSEGGRPPSPRNGDSMSELHELTIVEAGGSSAPGSCLPSTCSTPCSTAPTRPRPSSTPILTLDRDGAGAAAAAPTPTRRRRRPRAAPWDPDRAQGQHVHPRAGDHGRFTDPRRIPPALRRHCRHQAARGRGRDRGQDQPRRVRHGLVHGELGIWPVVQPVGHQPGARRVIGWFGRGRRRRLGLGGPSAPTPAARYASRRRSAASSGSSPPTARSADTA